MKRIKIFTLIMVIATFFIITGCGNNKTSNDDNVEVENDNTDIKLNEAEKTLMSVTDLFEENLAFDKGDYVKGNIPSGEYALIKLGDGSSYYCEKDEKGNVISTEDFDSFGYVKINASGDLTTEGILINVSAFDKLGVNSAKEIYEKLNNQKEYNKDGYYKVGIDIQQGTYNVKSIENSGYYAVMNGPVSDSNKIVSNDGFEGEKTIDLKDGQYLKLKRAQISKK